MSDVDPFAPDTATDAASDDTLDRVREWMGAAPGISMDGNRLTVDGEPPTRLTALGAGGDLRLVFRHEEASPAPGRAASVRRSLEAVNAGAIVEVTATEHLLEATMTSTVPERALNRHTCLAAIHGLAGMVEAAALAVPEAAGPTPEAEPAPPVEAERDQTRILERTWAPTHVVPKGGVPTWPTPDGRAPSTVRLEARVELSIAETRGDWARVVGANGWTGWLDRRRLEPIRTTPSAATPGAAAPAARAGGWSVRPLPLIGLFAVGVSAVLPWLRADDGPLSALEVPLAFLWDVTAAEPPHLGWLLLGLAVAIAIAAVTSTGRANLVFIPLGLAVLAVPLLFVAQVYRGVVDTGGSFGDALALTGYAPIVAILAGAIVLASARPDG